MEPQSSTAIVTGGSGGLGRAALNLLGKRGWRVANLDVVEDPSMGGLFVLTDVSDASAVAAAYDRVSDSLGPPDALICLAGVVHDAPVVGLAKREIRPYPDDHWQHTLAVNLTGTFNCAREFVLRSVKRRRPGTIVTCSSPAASGAAGQSAYAASKAGVEAFTRSLAYEVKPFGIRVCGFRPALTLTSMAELYPDHVLDGLRKQSLLGRYATADEIAEAILFLLTSPLISGETAPFDGGLRL